MIALVTGVGAFSEKYYGGGLSFIKGTITRIAKKEPILYLPVIKEIRLIDDWENVREKLEKENIIIPENLIKHFKHSTKYEEILNIYKEEILKNDVRIIFDPSPDVSISFSDRVDKLKLIIKGISPSENVCNDVISFDAYCLSRMTNKKLAIVYQWGFVRKLETALKYYTYGHKYGYKYPLELLKLRYEYVNVTKLRKVLRTAKILSVSEGVLEEIPIDKNKYDVKILEYALPVEEDLIKYRTKNKENYIVYFARLTEIKGVTDLPLIMRYITSQIKDVKLYIFGKFSDKSYENYVINLIKKLNLEDNIKFLGFLKDEDKYKIISKAKLVIYPSHEDSYSYVILESIAVGTPVITYALPGPYSIFKNLPAVRFVKEFDIKRKANEAIRILKMEEENYYNLVYNEIVDEFVQKHKGWDKVVEEIYSNILHVRDIFGA